MTLQEHIAQYLLPILLWVRWLVLINFAAVLFLVAWKDGRLRFGHIEAVWILAAMIGNIFLINWLFEQFGFVRLLGLSHIVFWTPLLYYLWKRLPQHPPKPVFGWYLRIFMVSIGISLIIDYIDLVRYFVGV